MVNRVAVVGLDWGDRQHAFQVRGSDGRRWSGSFGSRPEDIHAWVSELRGKYPSGTIAVVLEQSRGALLYALSRYEFLELLPVHPSRTASYRGVTRPSGAKSDPIDAALLCDYAEKHGELLQPVAASDEATRQLTVLVEWRRKLIEQRVAFEQQLSDTLKQYFPQAIEWGGPLGSPMSLDFLQTWPTLEVLRRSRRSTVERFYTKHGSRSQAVIDRRLAEILSAVPLHGDIAITTALSAVALSLVPLIRALSEQIECLEARIQQLWTSHPDRAIFESFPGAGKVLAPRLAVALGTDRSRWTAPALQRFSGIAPLIEESGSKRWVHSRWRCPKFVRQTFHEFAQASIPHCSWAAAFYQRQKERGKGHHAAIRALAFRWIRILVRCWKDHQPYDDSRYRKRLIEARSPLSGSIAA